MKICIVRVLHDAIGIDRVTIISYLLSPKPTQSQCPLKNEQNDPDMAAPRLLPLLSSWPEPRTPRRLMCHDARSLNDPHIPHVSQLHDGRCRRARSRRQRHSYVGRCTAGRKCRPQRRATLAHGALEPSPQIGKSPQQRGRAHRCVVCVYVWVVGVCCWARGAHW